RTGLTQSARSGKTLEGAGPPRARLPSMVSDPGVFADLAFVFLAAVIGGSAAWALRQPLILGYVVGGLLISPFTPGPSVTDPHSFDLFAEIGVVLLMFSIGVEFSVRDLLRVKWVALLGGPLGVLLCVGMGVAAGSLVGWGALTGLVIGMVISVSSTMVLARLLLDRGELHSRHGRIMMGMSIVEDLVAVALMVLLPSLGELGPGRFLAIALALGKAALILFPFLYLVSRVIPPLMTHISRMRSAELFLLVALAIALGTAALTQAVGLSLALGAFLAGLIISESDYAHETLARLLPLRDAFGALFFVTVGALIDLRAGLCHGPLRGGPGLMWVWGRCSALRCPPRSWWGSGWRRSGSSPSCSCRWRATPGTSATRSTARSSRPPSSAFCSTPSSCAWGPAGWGACGSGCARGRGPWPFGRSRRRPRATSWSVASDGWGAPSGRPSTASRSPTWSSRPTPTSFAACASGASRACSATPPAGVSSSGPVWPTPLCWWCRCRRSIPPGSASTPSVGSIASPPCWCGPTTRARSTASRARARPR